MGEKEIIKIDVGAFLSYPAFFHSVAPKLEEVELALQNNKDFNVEWDLTHLQPMKMRISLLTTFLSVVTAFRKKVGKPMMLKLNTMYYVVDFLSSVDFFKISIENNLFERMGYETPISKFNPNNKIYYYTIGDQEVHFDNKYELEKWKATQREEVATDLLDKFKFIVHLKKNAIEFGLPSKLKDSQLREVLSLACGELIVNSILHGRGTVYIGMQRTKRGVTVSVCDSGIGFYNGMRNNQKWIFDLGLKRPVDALFNASYLKYYEKESYLSELKLEEEELTIEERRELTGLSSAIDNIIGANGWVSISSDNAQLVWGERNWKQCLKIMDWKYFKKNLHTAKAILGENEIPFNTEDGYYQEFDKSLSGSRISFEIEY